MGKRNAEMKTDLISTSGDEKRLLFIINTAGQAYTWRYLIANLLKKGYPVKVLARDHGYTLDILQASGLEYQAFKTAGAGITRLLTAFVHLQRVYRLVGDFHPSLVIGFGVDAAITAMRLRKPGIVFIDDDHTKVQNKICALYCDAIITPKCFTANLGKRHIRIEGYKEMAYLHPKYFQPDPSILDELGIKRNEKYVVVRLNALSAVHDIGTRSFSTEDKYKLVEALSQYSRVFISAEGRLPAGLQGYRLPTSPTRIHHVLNYARLIITDTGTMATEATMLGTPGIICHPFAKQIGSFKELEREYGLLKVISEPGKAINIALELIQQPNLKEQTIRKSLRLLADKIDVTAFMIDFIENFPGSNDKYKSHHLNSLESLKKASTCHH
jgi:uncharacterized protein